ncbi:MAG: 50S ribosomal protein L33 [Proteobacteria bacterium]|nr:50S ribosomal protein L33 [Pseudomonadota bacterium]
MGDRVQITLVCTGCGARNYQTSRARKPATERFSIKKYCPACNGHTLHKESK